LRHFGYNLHEFANEIFTVCRVPFQFKGMVQSTQFKNDLDFKALLLIMEIIVNSLLSIVH